MTTTIDNHPAHTFLARKDVLARYGKGKNWKPQAIAGFPPATSVGRWRLDLLMEHEEGRRWPTNGYVGPKHLADPEAGIWMPSPRSAVSALPGRKTPGRKAST